MGYGSSSGGVNGITSGTNLDLTKKIVFDNALFGGPIIQGYSNFTIGVVANGWQFDGNNNGFRFDNLGVTKFYVASEGQFQLNRTVTAIGTTGNQTISKPAGTINVAAGNSSVTLTNTLITADSLIIPFLRSNDATAKSVVVVAGSGTATFTLNANATATVSIGFLVTN